MGWIRRLTTRTISQVSRWRFVGQNVFDTSTRCDGVLWREAVRRWKELWDWKSRMFVIRQSMRICEFTSQTGEKVLEMLTMWPLDACTCIERFWLHSVLAIITSLTTSHSSHQSHRSQFYILGLTQLAFNHHSQPWFAVIIHDQVTQPSHYSRSCKTHPSPALIHSHRS
jgi:hypothetical protein